MKKNATPALRQSATPGFLALAKHPRAMHGGNKNYRPKRCRPSGSICSTGPEEPSNAVRRLRQSAEHYELSEATLS